jgi:hypothetical protein
VAWSRIFPDNAPGPSILISRYDRTI